MLDCVWTLVSPDCCPSGVGRRGAHLVHGSRNTERENPAGGPAGPRSEESSNYFLVVAVPDVSGLIDRTGWSGGAPHRPDWSGACRPADHRRVSPDWPAWCADAGLTHLLKRLRIWPGDPLWLEVSPACIRAGSGSSELRTVPTGQTFGSRRLPDALPFFSPVPRGQIARCLAASAVAQLVPRGQMQRPSSVRIWPGSSLHCPCSTLTQPPFFSSVPRGQMQLPVLGPDLAGRSLHCPSARP